MSWLDLYERPVQISGPCSAESEEQVLQTALDLKATGKIHALRAGIWKPRTRPNSFEGVGEVGLEWLVNAGKETGLKVTTEVANAKHVEMALKAGVDILWIGARTTVTTHFLSSGLQMLSHRCVRSCLSAASVHTAFVTRPGCTNLRKHAQANT